MASANLELLVSVFAAWERGDFSSVEWARPDIEYVIVDGPAPGTWRGLAGLAEGSRSFLDAWEKFRTEAEEYRELDAERVLVLVHWSAHGKASGLDMARTRTKGALLFHLRDGKVSRFVLYWDRERAFADLERVERSDQAEREGGPPAPLQRPGP